jgi:hypothetical protein
MRVLLRHSKTRRFYVDPTRWTDQVDCARDFLAITPAEEVAQSRHLTQMEIVLWYEDPVCQLTLPLGDDAPPSDLVEATDSIRRSD